jgi:hypothetical protein
MAVISKGGTGQVTVESATPDRDPLNSEKKTAVEPVEPDANVDADVDIEMALLALCAQDVGEPTEAVDLTVLSGTEKRVLVEMLRRRLYGEDMPAAPSGMPDASAESPAEGGATPHEG